MYKAIDDMIKIALLVLMGAFLTGTFIGFLLGNYVGKDTIKREAIKVGSAHYTATQEGVSIFVWNTNASNTVTNK